MIPSSTPDGSGGSIVGVTCLGHDAAVAVVRGREILFASAAERYSRKKNDALLHPELVEEAARYAGRIDRIVYFERPLRRLSRQFAAGQYRSVINYVSPKKYIRSFEPFRDAPIACTDHHRSHAGAGYFTSGFDDAAVVIADGIGEWETMSVWRAANGRLIRIARWCYPHSLGLFYSAFTRRLGFKPNEEEYIVMGLAAFGRPSFTELIEREFFVPTGEPGMKLRRNLHRGMGDWRRDIASAEDLAASCQEIVEKRLSALLDWVKRQIPSENLVFGGGVALNCLFNGKLAESGLFRRIWILPDPGDGGSSIGAAASVDSTGLAWRGPYLGHDVGRSFDTAGACDALLAGEVIGVVQGRAEFGPRALGNRSLLADPRGFGVKEKVNRIKQREQFRPFAPIVRAERAAEFFAVSGAPFATGDTDASYMQFVVKCLRPDLLPAVCHVDGSSRVQLLQRHQNPNLYELLCRFEEKTDCPVLLNTSLNIKGEPLVNRWEDAVRFQERHAVKVF